MTEDEFDAFYAATFPRLTGQLSAFTGDREEAQDVVQEAFVRAWDRRGDFLADEAPEAWIRTVAMRLAVSRWRRTRRWLELVRRTPPPGAVPGPDPDHTALVAALRQLPKAQRMVIVLHHLCDVSVEQIASDTGAPVGTVKARLYRGRAALAKHLRVDEADGVDETDGVDGAGRVDGAVGAGKLGRAGAPVRKESGRV